MCGPSSTMQQAANSEQNLSGALMADFASRYGEQNSVLQGIQQQLNPILALGINQQGFSPEELNAFQTSAINNNAKAYANAKEALNAWGAGRSGQSTTGGIATGPQQQLQEALASNAAGNEANTLTGITEANYAQGRQNFLNALTGEQNVAQVENPLGFASDASGANQAAFGEQSKVAQEKNQEYADIAGAGVGLLEAPFTGGTSLIGSFGKILGGGGSPGGGGGSSPDSFPGDFGIPDVNE